MLKKYGLIIGLTLAAATFGAASTIAGQNIPPSIQTAEASNVKILTDMNGMSLYTFDKDTTGVSNCNGDCAVKWPPLAASNNAENVGEYTVIKRADGNMQWAHKGMPLYTWFKDKKTGDVTGDGVLGIWYLARP